MIYGYARASTASQNTRAQVAELEAAGCAKVFTETASGDKSNRKALGRAVEALAAGDQLLVVRLDRLARSSYDLAMILSQVADKGAGFRSLREAWADTTTPHGRLILTVFGGIAEFERELILTRTGEGRVAAMARGVKFGRRQVLSREQMVWAAKELEKDRPVSEIAGVLNVSRSTIYRQFPEHFSVD